jgi:hypothetical protein
MVSQIGELTRDQTRLFFSANGTFLCQPRVERREPAKVAQPWERRFDRTQSPNGAALTAKGHTSLGTWKAGGHDWLVVSTLDAGYTACVGCLMRRPRLGLKSTRGAFVFDTCLSVDAAVGRPVERWYLP